MGEEESTVGEKKLTSIPANYVSLAHLQERWIKEKERKEREKNEQEQSQKGKERKEREKNEQERLQNQQRQQEKSDKKIRKWGRAKRLNWKREAQQGKEEQRPEALVSVTTAEVGESETNNGSLKEKKQTLDPRKKNENPRAVAKERIAVGTHEPPATSTVTEDRRRPQRVKEGASKDSTVGVEQSFSRLSLNHWDRRYNDGYRKYSSSFKGGSYSRQFAGNARVWNTGDRTPVNMMWVKKGRVADTDGDASET